MREKPRPYRRLIASWSCYRGSMDSRSLSITCNHDLSFSLPCPNRLAKFTSVCILYRKTLLIYAHLCSSMVTLWSSKSASPPSACLLLYPYSFHPVSEPVLSSVMIRDSAPREADDRAEIGLESRRSPFRLTNSVLLLLYLLLQAMALSLAFRKRSRQTWWLAA